MNREKLISLSSGIFFLATLMLAACSHNDVTGGDEFAEQATPVEIASNEESAEEAGAMEQQEFSEATTLALEENGNAEEGTPVAINEDMSAKEEAQEAEDLSQMMAQGEDSGEKVAMSDMKEEGEAPAEQMLVADASSPELLPPITVSTTEEAAESKPAVKAKRPARTRKPQSAEPAQSEEASEKSDESTEANAEPVVTQEPKKDESIVASNGAAAGVDMAVAKAQTLPMEPVTDLDQQEVAQAPKERPQQASAGIQGFLERHPLAIALVMVALIGLAIAFTRIRKSNSLEI